MAMVLRSIYLDPTLDAELASRAEVEGTTKAELMRRFLIAGLGRPATSFSGYATEAPSAHAQRGAAHTAEPRAAYAAESAATYEAAVDAFLSDLPEQSDEPEIELIDLAAGAPAAPPARVASGSRHPLGPRPPAAPPARVVAEPLPRTAEPKQGDAPPARAAQPQPAASPARTREAAAPAATARAMAPAPRKPRSP